MFGVGGSDLPTPQHETAHPCKKILKIGGEKMRKFKKNTRGYKNIQKKMLFMVGIHISYFYSTTKPEKIQIKKNHNLLCSLDPPNQSWVILLVDTL